MYLNAAGRARPRRRCRPAPRSPLEVQRKQRKGGVSVGKAVETHGKGGVLAAKAVETQGKGGVLTAKAGELS